MAKTPLPLSFPLLLQSISPLNENVRNLSGDTKPTRREKPLRLNNLCIHGPSEINYLMLCISTPENINCQGNRPMSETQQNVNLNDLRFRHFRNPSPLNENVQSVSVDKSTTLSKGGFTLTVFASVGLEINPLLLCVSRPENMNSPLKDQGNRPKSLIVRLRIEFRGRTLENWIADGIKPGSFPSKARRRGSRSSADLRLVLLW